MPKLVDGRHLKCLGLRPCGFDSHSGHHPWKSAARSPKSLHMTTPQRSRNMRAIKSQDTKPEMTVRQLVHSLGYRYRLHRKDLPGKPDLVFPSRKKAILVHGCFWHMHDCRRGYREPKENSGYWSSKIARNRERDIQTQHDLKALGWDVLVIWECETTKARAESLAKAIVNFLEAPTGQTVIPASHFAAKEVVGR